MCGTPINATGTAVHDPISPAALAAALVMIAVGIALVLIYGHGKKQAWRPEQTFVVHDRNQPTVQLVEPPFTDEEHNAFDNVPLQPLAGGNPNGLSDTLNTSLLRHDDTAEE